MNSKIKQLAEQAGFCFWSDEPWKPEGAVIDWSCNYDEALEKFIELIQKECSNISYTYRKRGNDMDAFTYGEYEASRAIAARILQLFGD